MPSRYKLSTFSVLVGNQDNSGGTILFFQLINRRYEHASTMLTSNQGFEHWGQILHEEVMASELAEPAAPAGSDLPW